MSRTLTIFHNPRCSKSRLALAYLEDNKDKHDFILETILYQKQRITKDQLDKLVSSLKVNTKEPSSWKILLRPDAQKQVSSWEEAVDLLTTKPENLERPFVIDFDKMKAALGRPDLSNVEALVTETKTHVRTYATKSKTTNLKWKPSVPVQQTTLPDGTVFVARQPVVEPSMQSAVAPLINKSTTHKKLSESEIKELRQLRESDPSTWTRSKLAKKFGCSELFVGITAPNATAQAAKNQASANADAATNHGYRRKLILQERQKRRALW
ncbi:hypothetical protein [Parasitella parasitica]|uniref:Uncharacterized protein n=1 Tax=Parasitella parasitica TaxID=35722 RepID=A0A0B7N3T3_9FUNG|nr:hypothetical protein [Parasitella parasitica]